MSGFESTVHPPSTPGCYKKNTMDAAELRVVIQDKQLCGQTQQDTARSSPNSRLPGTVGRRWGRGTAGWELCGWNRWGSVPMRGGTHATPTTKPKTPSGKSGPIWVAPRLTPPIRAPADLQGPSCRHQWERSSQRRHRAAQQQVNEGRLLQTLAKELIHTAPAFVIWRVLLKRCYKQCNRGLKTKTSWRIGKTLGS